MQDPRFSWKWVPQSSDDFRRVAVEQFIARMANLPQAQAALSTWWSSVLASSKDSIVPTLSSFLRPLREPIEPALMEALRKFGDDDADRLRDVPFLVAHTLAAPAIGQAVAAASPSMHSFRRSVQLLHMAPLYAQKAMEDAFFAAVVSDVARRRAWVDELSNSPLDAIGYATRGDEEGVLQREPELWPKVTDPFRILGFRQDRLPRRTQPFDQLRVLRRLDGAAWLDVVENLRSPRLAHDAISEPEILRDTDLLRELLRASSPIFDVQGRWTRKVAAVVLAGLLFEHAVALWEAVSQAARTEWHDERALRSQEAVRELESLEKAGLSTLLRESYRVLLERPDGRSLAHGVLVDLIQRWSGNRAHIAGWSCVTCGIGALTRELADSHVKVVEQYEVWRAGEASAEAFLRSTAPKRSGDGHEAEERAVEGRPSLVTDGFLPMLGAALVSLARERETRATDIPMLWDWFELLLLGRDKGVSRFVGFSDMAVLLDSVQLLGKLFAELPNLVELWETTFRKLEPQRRRRMFFSRHMAIDTDIDAPTTILFFIGFVACARRAALAPDDVVSVRAWGLRMYTAARRFLLTTSGHDPNLSALREHASRFFAFLPAIFGEDLGGTPTVRTVLAPLESDPLLLSWACYSVWRNGIDPGRLKGFLTDAGIDLDGALRAAKQWTELTGGAKWQSTYGLAELAVALGLTV